MHIHPNAINFKEELQTSDQVDIIMRTKNRAILLPRALKSVLDQTHTNWHLYIVNDGGNQEEIEQILLPYTQNFKGRLTLIHNEKSLGVGAANNCALKQSKGDFVIVHDDDDAWTPKFLEKTTEFLQKESKASLVGVATHFTVIYEKILDRNIFKISEKPHIFFQNPISYHQTFRHNTCSPISFLMRKAAMDLVGLFNEDMLIGEDWDYAKRLLQIGDIGYIKESLAFYHIRLKHQNIETKNTTSDPNYNKTQLIKQENALIRHSIDKAPELIGLFSFIAEEKNKIFQGLNTLRDKIEKSTNKSHKT